MQLSTQVRRTLARTAVLLTAAGCVYGLDGLPSQIPFVHAALVLLAGSLVAGLVLPRRFLSAHVRLSLLAIDLLALGWIGCALVEGRIAGADARIPFISGYVVATLVAVVGHRMGAAALGVLGGGMVIAVGTALTVNPNSSPQPLLIGVQLALVAAGTFLTAYITGSAKREVQQSELKRLVDQEMRVREGAAAELDAFTQSLADSSTLGDVADVVIRYVRCHTDVGARALALEFQGDSLALWEESGRVDADKVDPRRLRLQESLSHVGSPQIIQRLQCHSTGGESAPATPSYRTTLDLPIQVAGRVAGVLFLADTHAGVIPPERIGILVDVARKTSEALQRLERLRDRENRRTALLLRQMREGVLLLGSEGQILLANPAARQALEGGGAELDANGQPCIGEITLAELAQTPAGISRRFRATVDGGENAHPTELACTALNIQDRGQTVGTLVTLSDVTEEERTRGRIIQSEKMTLVGQTLAGVAHELNNPLAALIGYADLLQILDLPEQIEKPVKQMREQALRATRIVRNLLNFARRRNPERIATSFADLVEGTVELFAYEARIIGVEIKVDLAEELPLVLADKHALQQVMVNLVQNALHALESWAGSRVLTIRARADLDGILVSVSDSGPGVPEDIRTRIFESFFTTKSENKGTGLGLALSRSIVQEHGGDLLLAPATGGGACFSLRLPKHVPGRATESVAGRDPSEPDVRLPERVLVVDDEVSVRETLVAQLGNLGASVDSAGNAREAQRLITATRYDALLVDIRMPGSSGLDLHKEIAEQDPLSAGRFVFMTGDFVNDDILQKARVTGRILLEKPFTMAELTTALAATAAGSKDEAESTQPVITRGLFSDRRSKMRRATDRRSA